MLLTQTPFSFKVQKFVPEILKGGLIFLFISQDNKITLLKKKSSWKEINFRTDK